MKNYHQSIQIQKIDWNDTYYINKLNFDNKLNFFISNFISLGSSALEFSAPVKINQVYRLAIFQFISFLNKIQIH